LRSTTLFVDVERFGPRTTVTSLAALFVALLSKLGLDTAAVFVTPGTAAAPTATVSVSTGNAAPAASGGGCEHVTSCPVAPHAHPVPVPLIYVSPAGSVSVTTTVLSSRWLPATFATVSA